MRGPERSSNAYTLFSFFIPFDAIMGLDGWAGGYLLNSFSLFVLFKVILTST